MGLNEIKALKIAAGKKKATGKKGYKIRARTPKKAKEYRKLGKAYEPYLEQNPVCAIQSPVCTYVATTVNHKAGRGENEVLDQETWEPSCSGCNFWIEANDQWARDHGHKISRHTKKDQ